MPDDLGLTAGKSGADNQSVQLLGRTCADNYIVGAGDGLIDWSVQLPRNPCADSWSVQLPDDLGLTAGNSGADNQSVQLLGCSGADNQFVSPSNLRARSAL